MGVPHSSDERVRELLALIEEERAKAKELVEATARADAMHAEAMARAEAMHAEAMARTDAMLAEAKARTTEATARADAMLAEAKARTAEAKARIEKEKARAEEAKARTEKETARADAYAAMAKKFEAALKSTKMINGVTFCSAYRAQNNTSESSVHLDRTAPKVNVIESSVAPVELPPEFYEQFVFHNLRGDEPCCNESNFKSLFQQMINDVQNGLLQIGWIRPEDALWVTELSLAGARTDIAVTMRSN
jgi:Tfp pilus assembly major pilin PilA